MYLLTILDHPKFLFSILDNYFYNTSHIPFSFCIHHIKTIIFFLNKPNQPIAKPDHLTNPNPAISPPINLALLILVVHPNPPTTATQTQHCWSETTTHTNSRQPSATTYAETHTTWSTTMIWWECKKEREGGSLDFFLRGERMSE